MPEARIPTAIETTFYTRKGVLRAALTQGQEHQELVTAANIQNEKIINEFTEIEGNDIYIPYFNNIKKYETEVEIRREISFNAINTVVLNNLLNLKSNEAKKTDRDTQKFVDMLKIITQSVSSTSTP